MSKASGKEMLPQRSDDMEVLRLRHENASLSQLFSERAEQIGQLLQERARLRGLVEHSAKVLEDLAHHLRTSLR